MLTDTDWQEMLIRLANFISQAQQGYWAKQKEKGSRDANEALEVKSSDPIHSLSFWKISCASSHCVHGQLKSSLLELKALLHMRSFDRGVSA